MSIDPATELEVFLHDQAIGRLERLPQARLRFTYNPDWVESEAGPISLALPVRPEPYEDDECGPFFAGLLPEGCAKPGRTPAAASPRPSRTQASSSRSTR
jgi:HipA-like protein